MPASERIEERAGWLGAHRRDPGASPMDRGLAADTSPTLGVKWLDGRQQRLAALGVALMIGSLFVLIGGANLDPGPIEARLGLAAREAIWPFGQVYGGWDPALWPLPVALSHAWAWGEGGTPSAAAIRWPAAIAALLLGLILSLRLGKLMGPRASVWIAICWFGNIALMDRSAGAVLDLIAALGIIGALDRMLSKGSDLVAGCWAALAFLAAGWPPVALIALATVVVGRQGARLSGRLLAPPLLAAVAWSIWAWNVTSSEAWAAALTLPLVQKPVWMLALAVFALALPWSPLALLALANSVRNAWPEGSRAYVMGWLQVTGACLLAGTLLPAVAAAARLPAIAGLAVAAAAVCETLWSGTVSTWPRKRFWAIAGVTCGLWMILIMLQGGYLAAAVPYYRQIAFLLIGLAVAVGLTAASAAWTGQRRWGLAAIVAVAFCLKLAHWGVYVPEWNYRSSKGPWGRAIGQWVPPNAPIYILQSWPADLMFATERPVRQLASPKLLRYKNLDHPQFVLLPAAELENWPANAPRLVLVRKFQDEWGGERVLARTVVMRAGANAPKPSALSETLSR